MSTHPARDSAGNQEIALAKVGRVRAPKGAPERYADWHWQAHQTANYHKKSSEASENRLNRAAREQRRRARALAEGVSAKPVSADIIRWNADTRHRIEKRFREGYVFKGGAVGGNEAYVRAPFVYRGLVSEEHPIYQAFVSRVRRRRHLRVGGTKGETYTPDSKIEGLDEAYIDANKAVCGIVRVEIDHVLTADDIVSACRAANVLLPNIIVGWQDAARNWHRPHLLWLLHDSVPLQGEKCGRFLSLYQGVLRGLTAALLPIGADPGGLFNCHRHKNPLCPEWHREVLAQQPYDLSSLKACVNVSIRMSELKERAAALCGGVLINLRPDHPDPALATGSNSVFRLVALWAREKIGPWRAEGIDETEFGARVADKACRIAAGLTNEPARSERAALRLAATITHWTWNVYKAPVTKTAKLSPDQLQKARAKGGKTVCSARKNASFELIGWAAATILSNGGTLRQAAVLDLVRPYGIKSVKTVARHWQAVRLAVEGEKRTFHCPLMTPKVLLIRRPRFPLGLPSCARPHPPVPAFLCRDASSGKFFDLPPDGLKPSCQHRL